jgi:putative sigma-54 modulation protein
MNTLSLTANQIADPAAAAFSEKILVRGIRLQITPITHETALTKGARLLRHHSDLLRVRFDLEFDRTKDVNAQFIAKGRIEIPGPDLIASVASEDIMKSLALLVDKLDRMLRERTRTKVDHRNNRPAGTEYRDRLGPSD